VRFDFFTGDDPWLGLYRSSDGDVGWAAGAGLLSARRRSSRSLRRRLRPGNRALGQAPDAFSNQAIFFEVDRRSPCPTTPPR
jgi:hypothetical protein